MSATPRRLPVTGMSCAACAGRVERHLATGEAQVTSATNPAALMQAVKAASHDAQPPSSTTEDAATAQTATETQTQR